MPALDFHSVLALGAAVSALLTTVSLLLAPMLGGSRATRLLAVGNLSFTLMLVVRMAVGTHASPFAYAAIWSLLVGASGLHWLALRELGPARGGPLRARGAAIGAALAALWVATASTPTPHVPAIVTGLATAAGSAAALRVASGLHGRGFALPRRMLVLAFGASAAFAVLHVVQRLGELARGDALMSPTAFTYFGAVLLFCTINAGFLVLMYLQLAQRVAGLAQTDELTGALNRRGFFDRVARLRTPSQRGALVLIDIDRFKAINDTHGHAVGDEVLRWFARTLRGFMRRDDLLVRMGGEEFCLLLPGVAEDDALRVAERIRVEFEARSVAPTAAGPLRITASFGVAPFGPDAAALDLRLRQADEALYAAKRGGRNRVVRWRADIGRPGPGAPVPA
jgi:diguanylate cyclase (GGDEF)-like protein